MGSQTFDVHTDLLTKHSDFFKAALHETWKEGQTRQVELQETDPEHFAIFKNFLYSGRIYSSKEDDLAKDVIDHLGRSPDKEWNRLYHSWVLGEQLLSTPFKDAVTQAIFDKTAAGPIYPVLAHLTIYPHSMPACGVRRLLIDIAVWFWRSSSFQKCGTSSVDCEFLRDICIAFGERASTGQAYDKPFLAQNDDGCKYHEHVTEGKPCYLKTFGITK